MHSIVVRETFDARSNLQYKVLSDINLVLSDYEHLWLNTNIYTGISIVAKIMVRYITLASVHRYAACTYFHFFLICTAQMNAEF